MVDDFPYDTQNNRARESTPPILRSKRYDQSSVFVPENLLREARRQRDIPRGQVPRICVLDPDGDIVRNLRTAGIIAVEMEAAALYAFARVRRKPVVCFAHVTNQMGTVEQDFEKGEADGSHDALELIHATARRWLAHED